MSTRFGRHPKTVRTALLGLAAWHVAEAVVLRRRRNRLAVLHDVPAATDNAVVLSDPDGVFVVAAGVEIDDATQAGARALATQTGREVLDLVPGDLPARRYLRLLRRVDPVKLRTDPFLAPGGAHQAVLVAASLVAFTDRAAGADTADTADAPPAEENPGGSAGQPRSLGALAQDTVAWQRHAPTTAGIALAPTLPAAPDSSDDRWAELEQVYAWSKPYVTLPPVLMGLEGAHLAAMVAGLMLDPLGGALALATWSAQPAAVLGGHPRRPGDRSPEILKASLFRIVGAAADWARTAAAGAKATGRATRVRNATPRPPQPDLSQLFEARRASCPWCGSTELTNRVTTHDLLQHKPGEFKLDLCVSCGHTFQNPRLSLAGLDYYYDEFYDGQAGDLLEFVFGATDPWYQGRADAVAAHTTPTAWLDVGTGHGHFCLSARQRWPEAVFDGLDLSDSIVEAEQRGWVDHGYHGLFPDLASGLPRSYDVVSMSHYLEHTRCPQDELDAAAKVLEPGGHLLIELPDPECHWAETLGRYWLPFFQPQHQHLIPVGNLCDALIERNFEIINVDRASCNQPIDLVAALGLKFEDLVPSPKLPWQPPASARRRMARGAMFLFGTPALLAAAGADQVLHLLNRDERRSNTYRVLARRI